MQFEKGAKTAQNKAEEKDNKPSGNSKEISSYFRWWKFKDLLVNFCTPYIVMIFGE